MAVQEHAYKVTRIATEFDKGNRKIHIWGVDDFGNRKKFIENTNDFFYIRKSDLSLLDRFKRFKVEMDREYKTFDNDLAYKVISYSNVDKKNLCDYNRHATYEADVPVELKFFRENGYEWSSRRHKLYFDLEIFYEQGSEINVEFPDHPITSIQFYSSEENKYFIVYWHNSFSADTSVIVSQRENIVTCFCDSEETVILTFFNLVKQLDPDLLTGWYSSGFDLPYLINRSKVLNLNYGMLSPLEQVKCYKAKNYTDIWRTYIVGRDHIDLLDAIKDLGYNLSNYKLATAAKEILGGGDDVEKLEEFTWRDWNTNIEGFLKYCLRDVEILVKIDEKLDIFSFYVTIQQLTNIPQLSLVLTKSLIVDNYILTEYHNKLVFPTSRFDKKRKNYMGALVLDPKHPGLQKNVTVVDYASLYPSVIIAFNISPETYICSKTDLEKKTVGEIAEFLKSKGVNFIDTEYSEELFGKQYLFFSQTSKPGILPSLMLKLLAKRNEILKEMNSTDDVQRKNVLHKNQSAIKIILNSAYGAMGFQYFRLYKPECADAITFFARKALMFLISELDKNGYTILYSDTDSAFFLNNGKSDEEVKAWIETEFKALLDNVFVPSHNATCPPEYKAIRLKVEKFLDRVYFGDAKKRYYGIEKVSNKKYIRGMNIIRKDAPTFLKTKLNELVELAVTESLTVDHLKLLRKEIETIPPIKLGIQKNFSRNFDEYTKNNPQHLKGVQLANSLYNLSITYKDVPYLFYIISKFETDMKPSLRNKVICLRAEDLYLIDQSKHLYDIDFETFFNKQVIEQLDEFSLILSVAKILQEYKQEKEQI